MIVHNLVAWLWVGSGGSSLSHHLFNIWVKIKITVPLLEGLAFSSAEADSK